MVYGAYFKDVNENKLRQLGIVSGIEVISIKKGKFEEIGIEKGFIITHINKKAVGSKTKFINTIKSAISFLRKLNFLRRNSGQSGDDVNAFAHGGIVNSPQMAIVGEAGSEYIIPARKAAQFSQNYLSGLRGSAAIPRFAEGGFTGTPNVNITTGAVTQMNGTNFITTNDLASAVQSGIDQTLTLLQSDLKTRRSLGMA